MDLIEALVGLGIWTALVVSAVVDRIDIKNLQKRITELEKH